jgi:hypothetical protein
MDLIPEGRFGYTAQEHAQRLTCTATIVEMSVFSLVLSYLFSHDSMSHHELRGSNKLMGALAPVAPFPGVLEAEPAGETPMVISEDTVGACAARRDGALAPKVDGLEHRAKGVLFEQLIGRTMPEATRQNVDSVEAVSLLSVRALPFGCSGSM